MRYDDRLRTVLAQPGEHPHDRAVRWRQLVELLARGGGGHDALFDQAIAEVEQGSALVDEQVRMAAARAIAPLPAPPELVRAFAADRLSVAAPVLAAARLTASEWAEVTAGASAECRRFIASLRADAPAAASFPPPTEPPQASRAESDSPIPSISEVVARIERLRQNREQAPSEPEAELAVDEPPSQFRWECDPAGDITWVDGVPRGAVIGRSIARGGEGGDIDRSVERAFASRIPFSDARLELAQGSIAGGSWKISAIPVFDPGNGRFCGYHGVAERDCDDGGLTFEARDPASLRELAHELKTPLNAIIGFAEIISGQYLGPAGQSYRDRAADIVAQARLLVTAIDDLDFAARLHGHACSGVATDLADVAKRMEPDLAADGASLSIGCQAMTSLDPALSQRLLARFCEAAIAGSPEPQRFTLTDDGRHSIVSALNPGTDTGAEPSLPLRLALGLARLAGGDLRIGRDRLDLLLPRA